MSFIDRDIEEICVSRLKLPLILALIGPRQVGKSTLLNRIKGNSALLGIAEKDTSFYFSMDDALLRAEVKKDFRYLEKEIGRTLGRELKEEKRKVLVIIDEVQKTPEIFDWLKLVFDTCPKTLKLVVCGSSSLQLKKHSVESLAGRISFVKMFPLSIRELITFETGAVPGIPLWLSLPETNPESFFRERQAVVYREKNLLEKLLEHIMLTGTLPGIYTTEKTSDKQVMLQSLINTYLEKDIRGQGEVGSLDDYTNLLKTLSYELGSTFNVASLSRDLGIAANTVKKYISILRDTFVLNVLPSLQSSKRKQFVKNSKMYFYDTGIANALAKRSEPEHLRQSGGFIFENLLINSFEAENENRGSPGEKYFFRDYEDREIDFVFPAKNKALLPVEIYSGKVFPKEKVKNFRAFFETFETAPYGLLIYTGEYAKISISGKEVHMLPWYIWR